MEEIKKEDFAMLDPNIFTEDFIDLTDHPEASVYLFDYAVIFSYKGSRGNYNEQASRPEMDIAVEDIEIFDLSEEEKLQFSVGKKLKVKIDISDISFYPDGSNFECFVEGDNIIETFSIIGIKRSPESLRISLVGPRVLLKGETPPQSFAGRGR